MNNINSIIFDFGGVLVDWSPRYMYKDVFENNSEMELFLTQICSEDWNLQQDKGRSLSEGTRVLQDKFPEHRTNIQLYYDQWEKMLKSDIPENVAILPQLKLKYKLYGLTNWSAETFPVALKRFSFFKYFDGIVVSGEEKMVKPDEDIFYLILKRYNLRAGNCLFIDDNLKNINTANKLGFSTIHLKEMTDLKTELSLLGIL